MTHLNLPILDQLQDAQSILIAGAGGGFDVYAGLPLYFTLREIYGEKQVHLANYSFTELGLAAITSRVDVLEKGLLIAARGEVIHPLPYLPEPYLAQWFQEVRGEEVPIWMFENTGALPLTYAYERLVRHLGIDAIILVDGGVDSIMRGDESGAGTLLEDTLSLIAVGGVDVPIKILACIGFGTEVEERVCHYNALQNMADLVKARAFYGACALTPEMSAFRWYESACRYVWEQPEHHKSHISTRIIPAVYGEFGAHDIYGGEVIPEVCLSPLMSLYWFFDAMTVLKHNQLADVLCQTTNKSNALQVTAQYVRRTATIRPRRALPY
ncbi:MAG: DUF1152 domain-containing protein [Anaerolineae bacterium]|jgi:hypothetical protein|nr:DUF1152 domain-containing protein [Anaerolineae bacterium]